MTIGVSNRSDYIGNGVSTVFPYNFRIFAAADLLVTVRDADGLEATLSHLTDYTVSGVSQPAGGAITLTGGALAVDVALSIRRVRTLEQTTDLRNSGGFFPESLEDTFDHAMMIDQQQQDQINRCLRIAETDEVVIPTLPAAANRAGRFLAFDVAGNPVASAATDQVALTAFATLDFVPTGTHSFDDKTIAVPGARPGDFVLLALPAVIAYNASFMAWVSANDVVTVRYFNHHTVTSDPNPAVFGVRVFPQ